MKYYIICGERSGDLHAANLAKSILKFDDNAQFRYLGGEHLASVVGEAYQFLHYKNISFMLLSQVILNIRKISKILNLTLHDIKTYKPHALILIDSSGFNLQIAKKIKPYKIPIHYYISPKIWAWNQMRVNAIKKLIDHMYVIIPFEKDFYKTFDYDVDYVGNPILDAIQGFKPNNRFIQENNLDSKPIIAILPGSRYQEVKGTLPLIVKFSKKYPQFQFVVAGVKNLPLPLYQNLLDSNPQIKLIFEQTYDLLYNAYAAIVTSGTATLETALFKVPQVVVYHTHTLTYYIAKFMLKIKYISLVNLIADRPIVKELIYKDFNINNLNIEFLKLLNNEERAKILEDYDKLKNIIGEPGASDRCAALIVSRIKQNCPNS